MTTPPAAHDAPTVTVVIEVPRWGFVKRGCCGTVDFVSPLPCPFNYGSVPDRVGMEGDLLDALVLGPRLPPGSRVEVPAWGAVGFVDRGLYDDKLVCCRWPPAPAERRLVLGFFRVYALAKGLLNVLRGHPGRMDCVGWSDAGGALGRARPRDADWRGPTTPF